MREIELHSKKYPGLVALVDDDDYELVSQYWWNPGKGPNTFYAICRAGDRVIMMHKLLTGYPMTDHKDRDGLNNLRSNLRPVTKMLNAANKRKGPDTSSRLKGVSWHKQKGKWQATIKVNRRPIYIGLFTSEIAAALAYDRAAVEAFGEYACTNRMLGLLPSQSDFALAA